MKPADVSTGLLILAVVTAFGTSPIQAGEPAPALKSALQQDFNLGKSRDSATQCFDMVTTLTTIEPDGRRGETESFRVKLKCVPLADAAGAAYQYTCKRFVYVKPDGTQVSVTALDGWTYTFRKTKTGLDDKGQVFGIDHSKFQQLADGKGGTLGPDKSYMVYNTFIDFHAFCDEFASPVAEGKGIQNLTRIGQTIVHAAANTTPPTSLVGLIKEGSHFKNGQITLTLKGLSLVDAAPCAVVEFDSGASSFEMRMEPVPGMNIRTVGGSHYFGDVYVDLASRWPRRVALRELIVSETKMPLPGQAEPTTIHSVQERQTEIRLVTKEAYEAE